MLFTQRRRGAKKFALLFLFASGFVAFGFFQSLECDSPESCEHVLEANPRSSLAHYRVAEIYFEQGSDQAAANELRSSLDGDLQPQWTIVWSHVTLGKIFDRSRQRDRALNEYRLALRTKDNTRGALDEASKYTESAYTGK
jgi:Tfp pilus assembly protein PilF